MGLHGRFSRRHTKTQRFEIFGTSSLDHDYPYIKNLQNAKVFPRQNYAQL